MYWFIRYNFIISEKLLFLSILVKFLTSLNGLVTVTFLLLFHVLYQSIMLFFNLVCEELNKCQKATRRHLWQKLKSKLFHRDESFSYISRQHRRFVHGPDFRDCKASAPQILKAKPEQQPFLGNSTVHCTVHVLYSVQYLSCQYL